MLIHPSSPHTDTLKSLLKAEMLRYQSAIGNDSPFREARKIKKNINRLKTLLAQQEQAYP
jgi:ribosomal protein L29